MYVGQNVSYVRLLVPITMACMRSQNLEFVQFVQFFGVFTAFCSVLGLFLAIIDKNMPFTMANMHNSHITLLSTF